MSEKSKRRWIEIANAEATALMKALPVSVREKLSRVSVTFSGRPEGEEVIEDGDEENLLGLFIGVPFGEEGADSELSPEIRLFIENIRDEVNGDETAFRVEVRTTLLHEIGHYLGLDEDGLELRGL
jgi:predicted Zn-dependent protease with MMP-like domain